MRICSLLKSISEILIFISSLALSHADLIYFFRFLWYNKYMYESFYIIYYLEGYFMRLFIALILLVLFFASPKAFLSVLMILFVFGCICYFIMMIFFTIPLILSVIILCLIVAGVVAFLVRYFNE